MAALESAFFDMEFEMDNMCRDLVCLKPEAERRMYINNYILITETLYTNVCECMLFFNSELSDTCVIT